MKQIQIEIPNDVYNEFFVQVWAVGDMGYMISAGKNLDQSKAPPDYSLVTVSALDAMAFFELGNLTADLFIKRKKKQHDKN